MQRQVIFSESEHLEGRTPRSPPQRGQLSPSAARPEPPARSIPVGAGTGRTITGSPAASSGPAAMHASGRLSLRFGPGEWAGSDPLPGETEPGPMGGVTHRREWSFWPHARDSLTGGCRCGCWPPAPGSGKRRVSPSPPGGWWGRGEAARASVLVIRRRPLGSSQLDNRGEAGWDTARWFP